MLICQPYPAGRLLGLHRKFIWVMQNQSKYNIFWLFFEYFLLIITSLVYTDYILILYNYNSLWLYILTKLMHLISRNRFKYLLKNTCDSEFCANCEAITFKLLLVNQNCHWSFLILKLLYLKTRSLRICLERQ